jgi:hypothetical protein
MHPSLWKEALHFVQQSTMQTPASFHQLTNHTHMNRVEYKIERKKLATKSKQSIPDLDITSYYTETSSLHRRTTETNAPIVTAIKSSSSSQSHTPDPQALMPTVDRYCNISTEHDHQTHQFSQVGAAHHDKQMRPLDCECTILVSASVPKQTSVLAPVDMTTVMKQSPTSSSSVEHNRLPSQICRSTNVNKSPSPFGTNSVTSHDQQSLSVQDHDCVHLQISSIADRHHNCNNNPHNQKPPVSIPNMLYTSPTVERSMFDRLENLRQYLESQLDFDELIKIYRKMKIDVGFFNQTGIATCSSMHDAVVHSGTDEQTFDMFESLWSLVHVNNDQTENTGADVSTDNHNHNHRKHEEHRNYDRNQNNHIEQDTAKHETCVYQQQTGNNQVRNPMNAGNRIADRSYIHTLIQTLVSLEHYIGM